MTDRPEPEVLPPITTAVAEYSNTIAQLAEMRQQLTGATFDCTTREGDKQARQTRRMLVELRVAIEEKRKELKAPLLTKGKLLDDEAKRITAEIVAMETPIDTKIKAEEGRRAAIVAEAERKEAARVASHKAQIDALRDAPLAYMRCTAAEIDAEIERLQAVDLELMDEDFRQQAHHTRQQSLGQLTAMHERAAELERQAAALAEERAENQRIAAAAAERQRRQQAEHDAALAEHARKAKEEADAREAEVTEQRRIERAEAAERERLQQAELDEARRRQQEADAREQARIQAEQHAEAARRYAERLQREQVEQAEWQAHLQTISLREAATEAAEVIETQWDTGHPAAQKLRAALAREKPKAAPRKVKAKTAVQP
jgi:hypothetical protein